MKKEGKKLSKNFKEFWNFLWHNDSLLSWIVFLVIVFVLIKFIFFPSLSFLTGTSATPRWSTRMPHSFSKSPTNWTPPKTTKPQPFCPDSHCKVPLLYPHLVYPLPNCTPIKSSDPWEGGPNRQRKKWFIGSEGRRCSWGGWVGAKAGRN